MAKKLLSLAVAILMVLAVVPMTGFSAPAKATEQTKVIEKASKYPGNKAMPCDAALDAALNIEGGNITFTSDGSYPWVVMTEGNRVYAQSGNGGYANSTSALSAVVNVAQGDIVQFDFKAWGEGSYTFWDHCDFAVNGVVQFTYGAYDNAWEQFIYLFPAAGTYTLTWTYTKDSSVNPTGDYFAVDEVYVGEPVHVEEIECTEELEVPVNRTATIQWNVLPAAAANKAVTFASDDTSIATVDENGVVFGVSEGETYITVASVENPEIFAICEVTVIDTGLTLAQIYGICTYDFDSMIEGWVTFTDVNPGNVTELAVAPDAYAATYAYGTVFGYTTAGDYFTAPLDDLGNEKLTAGLYTKATVTTMTFDYTRGVIYGVAADDDGNSILIEIEPASGAVTELGILEDHFYGICVDEDGIGYGVTGSGDIYTIDFDTLTFGYACSTGVSCSYVQDICYNFDSGEIYWAQILDADVHGLYVVNKEDGSSVNFGTIGTSGMEIVGMFIIPSEEPGAGEDVPVESVSINPPEGAVRVENTIQFSAAIRPFNATNKDVVWSVDNEDIITVDQNGVVTGVEVGTANVIVTTVDGGFFASAPVTVLPPLGENVAGYFFESQNEVDQWTFVDDDGDGYNWMWSLGSTATSYLDLSGSAYEGTGMIISESYYNPGYSALYPDNWAISPALNVAPGFVTVTLYAKGQDPSYASEPFMIYAGTTADPDSMTPISSEFVATQEWTQYSGTINGFEGGTLYIAIRHFDVTDQFILDVDQVEVWVNANGEVPPQPTEPPVEPTEPPVGPVEEMIAGYYFEAGSNAEDFTFVDQDGDGIDWVWQEDYSNPPYCSAYEGEGLIFSASYDNDLGMALTPDNWAITPAVELPAGTARVTLYACGQDASWAAEHFRIYAGTTADPEDMVPVSAEFVATGNYIQYEADLSDFCGGTVYVAIRHFNVTDMFMLNVDQVEVWSTAAVEPPVEHLWGDANGDGVVNSEDVLLVMRYSMELQELDPENIDPWCDVNQDGVCDMTDALLIARYVNEIIPELPVQG